MENKETESEKPTFFQASFYSLTNLPQPVAAAVGGKTEKTFKLIFDKETGEKKLVEDGKTQTYKAIQEATKGTTIREILKKYEQGDISVLTRKEGNYGDFTDIPTTWSETMQRMVDAENMFMKLPVDVREEFNHSPSQFLAQAGTDRMKRIIAKYKPKNAEEGKEPPKEAEGQQSMFKEDKE